MKEVNYPNMEKIVMFRNNTFDPVTKERKSKPPNLNCIVDTRYDTGLIICKKEKENNSPWKIILATIILIVVALFSFSIEIEVKNLDELHIVVFMFENPIVFVIIISIIVVLIVILKYR